MIITAWIVFISLVGLIIANIILYKKNKTYRNKIKKLLKRKLIIVLMIFLMPILIYTIGTSFLIMVQGDCFEGYYCGYNTVGFRHYNNFAVIYYNDNKYNFISVYDEELLNKAYEYGTGEWEYTETYIVGDSPISFPYFAYWCPKFFRNEVIVPGDLEPIYLRVEETGGGTTHYIRSDVSIEE